MPDNGYQNFDQAVVLAADDITAAGQRRESVIGAGNTKIPAAVVPMEVTQQKEEILLIPLEHVIIQYIADHAGDGVVPAVGIAAWPHLPELPGSRPRLIRDLNVVVGLQLVIALLMVR